MLFKQGYIGKCIREYYRAYEGDTRSLDYSSYILTKFLKTILLGGPKP